MDQFMVDLGPDGTAYNEDEVVLIGGQGDARIACEAVAQAAGTIPYEILVGLNDRIPREYLGGGAASMPIAADTSRNDAAHIDAGRTDAGHADAGHAENRGTHIDAR
jgi:hypothetical protein